MAQNPEGKFIILANRRDRKARSMKPSEDPFSLMKNNLKVQNIYIPNKIKTNPKIKNSHIQKNAKMETISTNARNIFNRSFHSSRKILHHSNSFRHKFNEAQNSNLNPEYLNSQDILRDNQCIPHDDIKIGQNEEHNNEPMYDPIGFLISSKKKRYIFQSQTKSKNSSKKIKIK